MMRNWYCLLIFGLSILSADEALALRPLDSPGNIAKGKVLYESYCIFCHGIKGEGDGAAAFFIGAYSSPRPRNFTAGTFKFRSTPTGEVPTDEDLFRTVTKGIPGYMPPTSGLSEGERWQVIAYIKTFSPLFQEELSPPVDFDRYHIPPSPESIARGRKVFQQFDCGSCHRDNGQETAEGIAVKPLKDSRGLISQPPDLSHPQSFKNGYAARDIVRSLLTGLDGSPMPSFAESFVGQEDDAWHVANYILSLSKSSSP